MKEKIADVNKAPSQLKRLVLLTNVNLDADV